MRLHAVDWELVGNATSGPLSPEVRQKRELLFREALGAPRYSRQRQVLRIIKGLYGNGLITPENVQLAHDLKALYDTVQGPTEEEKRLAEVLTREVKATDTAAHGIKKANADIADLLLGVSNIPFSVC